MKSYSLWINKKKQPRIYSNNIKFNNNYNSVFVKTIYSGISKGTERLVSSKKVAPDQYELMKAPFQEGSFNLPIKYGYINIGKIIDGPKKFLNRNIFSLFPHQTLYELPINNINLLPKTDPRKYILTANMETAINIFWDSKPYKKNKILVMGLGSVGLLTAYFFKINNYKNIYVYDSNDKRKKIANYLGLNFLNPKNINDFDIIINTTSDYKVLNSSIKKLNLEGKIIEASWYGSNSGVISLGGYFHSKRIQIISSQVSKIPIYIEKKYNYKKRLNLAIKSLQNPKLEKLITSESSFFNLENDYLNILQNDDTIMHLIKY